MDEILLPMRNSIQEALDDLASPRSSSNAKTRALQSLERQLVSSCTSKDDSGALESLLALQYTFECNIPCRLLSWISTATVRLDQLTNKGTTEEEHEPETSRLASQLSSSLSLIQGVVLIHPPSKIFLGRKYALEILLDLLLVSRHFSNASGSSPSRSNSKNAPAAIPALPLSSVVLDTLLCVLVDSSGALRAFEEANGVQAVVKILKRAGTPREVRMKCLEFLYFYLLDETTSQDGLQEASNVSQSTSTPPSVTPHRELLFRHAKPSVNATPLRPSRYGSGTTSYSFPSSASAPSSGSSTSSRSASGSSSSSAASSSTAASSVASSPDKSQRSSPHTPPGSPPLPTKNKPPPLQPRSMMMLRKEVDYVPLSPKKPSISKLGSSVLSKRTCSTLSTRSRLGIGSSESITDDYPSSASEAAEKENVDVSKCVIRDKDTKRRTTDEKKELLGTMLGNVDALVEGVRKAGIWGLG